MMRFNRSPLPEKQQGAATLVIAMVLLFSLSIMTLYSGKVIMTEYRITGNEYRAVQAFEAAQAGFEVAYNNINTNDLLLADDDGDNIFTLAGASSTGTNNYTTSYSNTGISTIGAAFSLVRIQSTGTSDDGSASTTIEQLVQFVGPAVNNPDATLSVLNNFNGGGATDITINPNTGISVMAGSSSVSEANIVISPALATLSGDGFFDAVFGQEKATVKAQATVIECTTANTCGNALATAYAAGSRLFWVTDPTGAQVQVNNLTLGTDADPVMMIVDDNFKPNGNTVITGATYVIGDWAVGSGNALMQGAVFVEGDFNGTGTPNLNYNDNAITNLPSMAYYAKVAGTWKDF